MEYNSDFRYDLKVGQVAEQALAKIFEGKKVEVKRDRKARLTGNVFVEYESRGKPSGISTSEADYWCFVIEETFILINSSRLKEIVEPLKGTDKERRGGDNNTSVGVLLRIKDLINTQRK
tara:strand:- start:1097 stop:1456 length:360 start_codon:yes stop_codon:yes gene_type:complete